MSNVKRKRTHTIYIKLNDQEYDFFIKKFKNSGYKTMREFVTNCIYDTSIYIIDTKIFDRILTVVSRNSNNINQMTKVANTKDKIYSLDLKYIKNIEDTIKDLLKNIKILVEKPSRKMNDIVYKKLVELEEIQMKGVK